jgi:hypothetical protein
MMESERRDVTQAETISSFALWYGVLAGPLAWGAQLVLVFGLPEAVACAPGAGPGAGTFAGIGIRAVIQIINGAAAALALLALFVSYRAYHRLRATDGTEAGRARWMAVAGLFNSALFLMLIGVKFASPFFLGPCGRSP